MSPLTAKVVIVARGESIASVADALGLNPQVLRRVLNGQIDSWPKLRRDVSAYLDMDERVLFSRADPDAIVAI